MKLSVKLALSVARDSAMHIIFDCPKQNPIHYLLIYYTQPQFRYEAPHLDCRVKNLFFFSFVSQVSSYGFGGELVKLGFNLELVTENLFFISHTG